MGELFAGWRFVPARMRSGWRMLLIAAAGVVAAAALLAAAPIYAGAMADLGLQFRLGNALAESRLNWVAVENLRPDAPDRERRRAIDTTFEARLGWLGEQTLTADRSSRLTLDIEAPLAAPSTDATAEADAGPDWAAFVYALNALDDLTTTVEGRLPDPAAATPEVVLLDGFQRDVALDGRLTLHLGGFDDCLRRPFSENEEERADEVQCEPTTRATQSATVTVVGFVRPDDPTDPRWEIYQGSLEVPAGPAFASLQGLSGREAARAAAGEGSLPLLTVPGQLEGAFATALPLTAFSHRTGIVVDVAAVETDEVDRAIAAVAALQTDIDSRLELPVRIAMPAARELERFRNSLSFNQVPLLLILLQVAGIVVYYVVIVSSMLVERQAEEISVLRSRGASTAQLVGLYLIEAVAIAAVAVAVGPWLAGQVVGLLGFTPTFQPLTDGRLLPVTLTPLAYLLGTGGALLALLAMLLPAFGAARRGIVDVKAEQSRPPGRSVIQRYYLDLAAIVLAGFLLWQLGQRGSVFDPEAVGGWSSDPLLLLSPFVFTLAVAALVLRVYPPLLRWAVSLLLTARSTAVALGLRRAARAPAQYARLVLLLIMAISVGTFAASYGPTVDASHEDRVRYETGADFRTGIVARLDVDPSARSEEVRSLAGVADAALATREAVQTAGGAVFPLLGLDAARAPGMLWFREDFAGESLPSLLRRLESTVPPGGGVELPADAIAVTIGVFGETGRTRSLLWARIRDAEGRHYNQRIGAADFEGWRTLAVALPEDAPLPLSFTGILVTDERATGVRQAGALYFDDLEAVSGGGRRTLLDDFEGRLGWTVFSFLRANEEFVLSEEQALSGDAALKWSWPLGIAEGRRLLALNAGNVPLAAIVSPTVTAALGVAPGDVVMLQLDDFVVPFSIRAEAELFPTLHPDTGFVIVNREDLEALAAVLDVVPGLRPNELWVQFEASASPARTAELAALLGGGDAPLPITGRPRDRAVLLARVRADPTLQASGSGILAVAFGSVLALAALGYVVTLVLEARGRTLEFAVLRAVGSSRLQILRAMVLEWALVLALGVVIGVLLGRQIAGVMLSFLDVTEEGARVLPPFVLQTDWLALGLGAAFLFAVVATGLALAWAAAVRRADATQLRITR